MNIDQISPSILHVTASSNIDVSEELKKEDTKTIAELIDDEKESENSR